MEPGRSGTPQISVADKEVLQEAAQGWNQQRDSHFVIDFKKKIIISHNKTLFCAEWNDNSLPLIEILID